MNEYRDSSDRLTFDFYNIDSSIFTEVTNRIVKKFQLETAGKKILGIDEIFQDYKSGEMLIGLEWDNWSGYIINARTKSSEELARNIANFVHENYDA